MTGVREQDAHTPYFTDIREQDAHTPYFTDIREQDAHTPYIFATLGYIQASCRALTAFLVHSIDWLVLFSV